MSPISEIRCSTFDQMAVHEAKTLEELWLAATKAFEFLELDQALLILAPVWPLEYEPPAPYSWKSDNSALTSKHTGYHFKIEYPLINRGDHTEFLGRLVINKYTRIAPIKYFTIRRIEQLQRDLTKKIGELRSYQKPALDTTPYPAKHRHELKN